MWLLWVAIALASVFWIWTLVDCIGRPLDGFRTKLTPNQWDKLAWLGIIVTLLPLGSLLYLGFVALPEGGRPGMSEEAERELASRIEEERNQTAAAAQTDPNKDTRQGQT